MAYKDKAAFNKKQTEWKYWVCPKCGRKASAERRYCVCHADLYGGPFYISLGEPPEILGKVNMDLPNFTCNECKNCAYCESFGVMKKNPQGFGGLDCKFGSDSPRCRCCKIQVKSAIEEGLSIKVESRRGNL